MNIQQIYDRLDETLQKLNEKGIDDEAKLEIELMVIQLKRQIRLAIFDPLKEIDSLTVADLSNLTALAAQVKTEIDNEKQRTVLLQKMATLAKIGLKAAGLPIPS